MKGLSNLSHSCFARLRDMLWLFFAIGTDQYHWLIDPRISRIDAIVWHTYKHRHAAMRRDEKRRVRKRVYILLINIKNCIFYESKKGDFISLLFSARSHMHAMWAPFPFHLSLVTSAFFRSRCCRCFNQLSQTIVQFIFILLSLSLHSLPSHIILSLRAT